MNVLLLSASLPYPTTSGGALRVYSLIRALNKLGHAVHLLCYSDEAIRWKDSPLADLCKTVVTLSPPRRSLTERLTTLLFTRQADVANRLFSDAMVNALGEMLGKTHFDLVQAEGIEMAWLLPHVRKLQAAAKLCFDTFNAEYELQRVIATIDAREPRRWLTAGYSWIQSGRIARFEREMGELADLMLAVSPEDSAALKAILPGKSIPVIPSAIAVDEYGGSEAKSLGPHALVFTGKMDYRPNVDAMIRLGL